MIPDEDVEKMLMKMLVTVLDGCFKNFCEKFVVNILKLLIDRIPTCIYFLKHYWKSFLRLFWRNFWMHYLDFIWKLSPKEFHENLLKKFERILGKNSDEISVVFFLRIDGDILWKLSVKIARRFPR